MPDECKPWCRTKDLCPGEYCLCENYPLAENQGMMAVDALKRYVSSDASQAARYWELADEIQKFFEVLDES